MTQVTGQKWPIAHVPCDVWLVPNVRNMSYPTIIENLINRFTKLPGVGRRSAERIVFWLLNNSHEESRDLAGAITELKEKLMFCKICNNLSDTEVCLICNNPSRDQKVLCVVENPKDLLAIERSGAYNGLYHVLLGTISPAEGRGPENLNVHKLIQRIRTEGTQEVVIATDPDNEGEMTALFLTKQLSPLGVKITRIGLGIPMGSAVEFADISTLSMSLRARREITAS